MPPADPSPVVRSSRGVTTSARAFFLPAHSDPREPKYVFGYAIRIANDGPEPVRLLWRRWLITDGTGRSHEVRGAGVVGEQPRLEPGSFFEYQSFCPLPTPSGTMEGAMTMQIEGGTLFEVPVGPFTLDTASALEGDAE